MVGMIRRTYRIGRNKGFDDIETTLMFGTPVLTGIAPIAAAVAYSAANSNFSEHPYLSAAHIAILVGTSVLVAPYTAYLGLALGCGLAVGRRLHRLSKRQNKDLESKL